MRRIAVALLVLAQTAKPPPPQSGSALVDCLGARPKARWLLPADLRELSGLVLTDEGHLLAHDDERAQIAEIDYRTGKIVKRFRFGRSVPLGDFEAIAVAGQRLFLSTSDGVLYEGREGGAGAAVPYSITPTNAGARCEIEGLTWEPKDRSLLFLCKTPRRRELRGAITLLRWSVDQNRWMTPERITIPLDRTFQKTYGEEFRGGDLARDPRTGRYLAIDGINRTVVELTPEGRIVGVGFLGKHHRQAEGLAIAKDGTVLVGDEGGKGAGQLTVYACQP